MNVKDGLEAITNEILDDVQKEAQAIILAAENEAKETLKVAKAQADQNYQNILVEAKTKSEGEQRRIASTTEIEIRNLHLQTKENLVDCAFQKTRDKLEKFIETKKYQNYLLRLIEQIAKQMDRKNLVVQLNAKDKTWLTQETLSALSKKLSCQLTLSTKTEEFIGGCKIQTEDGKITYDGTIDNKLQEIKPTLRLEVAKILFGKEA